MKTTFEMENLLSLKYFECYQFAERHVKEVLSRTYYRSCGIL